LAFELLAMKRLGSYSNPDNERSTRALLGVGFVLEGVLRSWHRHGERYLDVNVFGMLREEWSAGDLAKVPVSLEGELPAALAATASKFGITCEKATPSDAKQATPSTVKIASSAQSFGQPRPKKIFEASTTSPIWTSAFVAALPSTPAR